MASQDEEAERDDIIAVTNKIVATKINLKNCFQLKITEVCELLQYDRIEAGDNWQRISTHLMNQSRIFSYKVDSLYGDAAKVVSNTNKFTEKTEEKSSFFPEKKAENKCDPVSSHLDVIYRQDEECENPIAMACLLPNKGLLLNILPVSPELAVQMPLVSMVHSCTAQSEQWSDIEDFNSRQFEILKDLTQFKQDCNDFVASLCLAHKEEQSETTELCSFYGNTIEDMYNLISNHTQQASRILDSIDIAMTPFGSDKMEEVGDTGDIAKADTIAKSKKKKNKKVFEPVMFNQCLPKIFRSQLGQIKRTNRNQNKKHLTDLPRQFIPELNYNQNVQQQQAIQHSVHHSQLELQPENKKTITNVITTLKLSMLQAIKEHHPATTLKVVLGCVADKITPSQMPFILSALLHLCAQHGYVLKKSEKDIVIKVAGTEELEAQRGRKQSKMEKPHRTRD